MSKKIKVCKSCKSDLTEADSVYRKYTVTGRMVDGVFKDESTLGGDGKTYCMDCDKVI
jgi:hypothetical protein